MSNVLNMVSEQTFVTQTNAIKDAIDAISGGGSDVGFDLLPSGTVQITNGRFSLSYQGTAPAVNTAKIILVNKPYGIHDDVSFGVNFANGIASFAAGQANGYMTVEVECVVIIGTYTKKITFLNFPVHYGDDYGGELGKQPEIELSKNGDDWVGTLDLYPKNVSPSAYYGYDGTILLYETSDNVAGADCVIENGTITISNAPSWSELEFMHYGTLENGQGFYFLFTQGE